MKINGFEYTEEEIFAALRARGYRLELTEVTLTDETFPGGIETYKWKTHCALKEHEEPAEKNIWDNVAIKEFQKEFIKPPLV